MPLLRDLLEKLLQRRDLTEGESQELLRELTNPETPPAMSGAVLAALRSKGVVADELRGFARLMRSLARRPEIPANVRAIDIVGTGGDASGSVNISTGKRTHESRESAQLVCDDAFRAKRCEHGA